MGIWLSFLSFYDRCKFHFFVFSVFNLEDLWKKNLQNFYFFNLLNNNLNLKFVYIFLDEKQNSFNKNILCGFYTSHTNNTNLYVINFKQEINKKNVCCCFFCLFSFLFLKEFLNNKKFSYNLNNQRSLLVFIMFLFIFLLVYICIYMYTYIMHVYDVILYVYSIN